MAQPKLKKLRIGDLLVENGIISEQQLKEALQAQKVSGHRLGQVLIDQNLISEEQLTKFLAQQLNIEYIDLRNYDVKEEIIHKLPEAQARRFRVIALDEIEGEMLLGMADPTNIIAFDEVSRLLKCPIQLVAVRESDLLKTIDSVYRHTTQISDYASELGRQVTADNQLPDTNQGQTGMGNAPVMKLLSTLMEDAVQVGASDIHIEPEEKTLRIRFRIDGVLKTQATVEPSITGPLLTRLKLMAGLDISEKRVPHDGRFNMWAHNAHLDVRLSTLPLPYGESAVMRLLNQSAGIPNLEQLGMPDALLKRFRNMIHSPHGIILVTGPTGSGKTTTLYSALTEINDSSVKIITAEDPVEYRLQGISQVQVNSKVGLSFAKILRAMLRQDPDIALIGEMRDKETVEIGLRTAMTGHLVFSTLHTNDAISSVMRLMDMGAEPFLLAASLRGIMAQRLVRKICDNCSEPAQLDSVTAALLKDMVGQEPVDFTVKQGRGCSYCNKSGYDGRIGIYEFLELTGELVDVLQHGDIREFSSRARQQAGFQNLKQGAIELVKQGVTTVDEVLRVTFGADE